MNMKYKWCKNVAHTFRMEPHDNIRTGHSTGGDVMYLESHAIGVSNRILYEVVPHHCHRVLEVVLGHELANKKAER